MVNHVKLFPKVEKYDSVCGAIGISTFFHECNMLIRAYVLHDFGIVPNCLTSISANIAGFK